MQTKHQQDANATIVARASRLISGFSEMHHHIELKMSVSGKSRSTLSNYVQHVVQMHCIVPAGGLNKQQVETARSKGKFLFPVKALSKVFRARFVAPLRTGTQYLS